MNPWRGLRGLPREVWLVCASTLINRLGTMALPFLVLYLTKGRRWTPAAKRATSSSVSLTLAVLTTGKPQAQYSPIFVGEQPCSLSPRVRKNSPTSLRVSSAGTSR